MTNADWPLVYRCLGIGLVVTLLLILNATDAAEIRRRARQAFRLIAAAGPCFVAAALSWACPGRSPSRAHPAAKAMACDCTACTTELSPVDFAEWERDVRAGRQA